MNSAYFDLVHLLAGGHLDGVVINHRIVKVSSILFERGRVVCD